jgi:hypothetical protein
MGKAEKILYENLTSPTFSCQMNDKKVLDASLLFWLGRGGITVLAMD